MVLLVISEGCFDLNDQFYAALTAAGYHLKFTRPTSEAFLYLDLYEPTLVLIDLPGPLQSSLSLAQAIELSRSRYHRHIVILSSSLERPDYGEYGYSALIHRACDPSVLVALISGFARTARSTVVQGSAASDDNRSS